MAYEHKNLSVLAHANGFTLWHYAAREDEVRVRGYFNAATEMVREGDMILVSAFRSGHVLRVSYKDANAVVVQGLLS